jgi:hypothetical protein
VLKPKEVPLALKEFQQKAKGSGLRLTPVSRQSSLNIGKYERHVYKTQIQKCSFIQLHKFITILHDTKSKTGLLKFAMEPENDGSLSVAMELVMYTE